MIKHDNPLPPVLEAFYDCRDKSSLVSTKTRQKHLDKLGLSLEFKVTLNEQYFQFVQGNLELQKLVCELGSEFKIFSKFSP